VSLVERDKYIVNDMNCYSRQFLGKNVIMSFITNYLAFQIFSILGSMYAQASAPAFAIFKFIQVSHASSIP